MSFAARGLMVGRCALLGLAACATPMSVAESKVIADLEAGRLPGVDQLVRFDELARWSYVEGLQGMPAKVKELSGKRVAMVGYWLPIDGPEALLVDSLAQYGLCRGPEVNAIVRVVLSKGKAMDNAGRHVKVVGTFKVEATIMDGYCVDIYQLHADSLEVID